MNFLNSFFSRIWDFGAWLLDGLLYVIKSVLYVPFDAILTVIETFIVALTYSIASLSGVMSWLSLPSQMIYLLNACGFSTGLTLIATAIGIRLTLNLIPASLTRV